LCMLSPLHIPGRTIILYNSKMTAGDPIENLEGGKRANAIRVLVISLIVLVAVAYILFHDMASIRKFIVENGTIGLIVSILVYAVLGATLVPTEPLTILIGAAFSPLIATIAATVGNMLAAMIEYYMGLKISNASSFIENRKKLPFGLGKMPVTSPIFLIFGRMVPGYGSKLVSVISGIYNVPIILYIWTAIIPTALGAAIFAYGGFGILHIFAK
jgi:uncharacterized membrane protein YdjX (TVP38/TMEM64 family)